MKKELLHRTTFRNILVLLAATLCVSIFMYYVPRKDGKRPPANNASYVTQLPSPEYFQRMQGAPLSRKFGGVTSVKVVYVIRQGQIYFLNSAKYKYHFDFCSEVLGYDLGLEAFNTENYGSTGTRKYYLANLNYYPWMHRYAIEFVSDDRINAGEITTLYTALQKTTYLRDSLSLLVSSDHLTRMDASGALTIPRLYPSQVYASKTYQAVNEGETYGTLRKVADLEKEFNNIGPHDIILIEGTPLRIPPCAGIITSSFQTPLSHISVLAHNRSMPAAVLTGWKNDKKVALLLGKPVRIHVNNDSLKLTEISAAELEGYWSAKPAPKLVKLRADLSTKQLLTISSVTAKDRYVVGNKAAHFGELSKLSRKRSSDFNVPEGAFAIPFYFYQQHISKLAVQDEVSLLLQHGERMNKTMLASQLKKIRTAIKQTPIDPQLVAAIEAQIRKNNYGNSYRFRSSSNAEDMDGFSGAGLYDSKTGILGDTAKSIEKAIKNVWASAWSDAAWQERALAGIDQKTMMMGILVHRNFPEEKMNGVAITRNLYRPTFLGFTVNVQLGETSVVAPPEGVTCEQFVCMDASDLRMFNSGIAVDYITYSSLAGNKPLLTKAQVEQLYDALSAVKRHYYWQVAGDRPQYESYALDIEFKFDKNGKLYLKQVRPYR